MKYTYRIETQFPDGQWKTCMTWWGMLKGKTEGAMMVLDAFYGGKLYRSVCEQTGKVIELAGGRKTPIPQ